MTSEPVNKNAEFKHYLRNLCVGGQFNPPGGPLEAKRKAEAEAKAKEEKKKALENMSEEQKQEEKNKELEKSCGKHFTMDGATGALKRAGVMDRHETNKKHDDAISPELKAKIEVAIKAEKEKMKLVAATKHIANAKPAATAAEAAKAAAAKKHA